MKDLDKITKLQIAEAIENIKACKDLEISLRKNDNQLEREISMNQAGAMEWKELMENLSLYDPEYDRLLRNKTCGHRNFSVFHGCG